MRKGRALGPPTLTEGTRQFQQAEQVVSGDRRTKREPSKRVISGRREGGESSNLLTVRQCGLLCKQTGSC